jgi:hypothetical protein
MRMAYQIHLAGMDMIETGEGTARLCLVGVSNPDATPTEDIVMSSESF